MSSNHFHSLSESGHTGKEERREEGLEIYETVIFKYQTLLLFWSIYVPFCLGGFKDLLSAAVERCFWIKIDRINNYVRATVRKGKITVILELPLKVFDGKNSESLVR